MSTRFLWRQKKHLATKELIGMFFNCVTQTIGRDRNRIWENQIHNCIVMCLSKQFCCCWAKNLRFHNNCSGYEAVWQNLVQRTLGTLRAGTFLLHLEVGHNIYCDDQGFNQSEYRHLNRLTWLLWLWILLKRVSTSLFWYEFTSHSNNALGGWLQQSS